MKIDLKTLTAETDQGLFRTSGIMYCKPPMFDRPALRMDRLSVSDFDGISASFQPSAMMMCKPPMGG